MVIGGAVVTAIATTRTSFKRRIKTPAIEAGAFLDVRCLENQITITGVPTFTRL